MSDSERPVDHAVNPDSKTVEYPCCVPWIDGRPLINAIGTSETECHVNLTLFDLSDDELQRVVILPAAINIEPPNS